MEYQGTKMQRLHVPWLIPLFYSLMMAQEGRNM